MRKSVITPDCLDAPKLGDPWLDLERLARVEITSEDPRYPIEAAFSFSHDGQPGWLAGGPGLQVVRLRFDQPQRVRRIWLHFAEPAAARTQEFVLRWGTAGGQPAREIVRQQWVFHPGGSTHETEDYRVALDGVTVIELAIIPDVVGGEARASLAEMRIA